MLQLLLPSPTVMVVVVPPVPNPEPSDMVRRNRVPFEICNCGIV